MGVLSGMRKLGKKGQKIRFDVQVHRVYNVLPGVSEVRTVLKRGNKQLSTQVSEVKGGEAIWDAVLNLHTSMYPTGRGGEFERKEVILNVREHLAGREKTYANVAIDIGNFIPQDGYQKSNPSEFKVAVFQGTKELPTHLHITVQSEWVDDAESNPSMSETSSVASDMSVVEAEVQTVVVGTEASYVVYARDTFGNKMTRGGERTEAHLQGPSGTKAQYTCNVKDFNDGSYLVTFVPDKPGRFRVRLVFNNEGNGVPKQFQAIAADNKAKRAMDCVLRGPGVGLAETVTGETVDLFVQSASFERGDLMSGVERVSVLVTAPSGVTLPAKCTFDAGRFKAELYWPETGRHTVEAKLSGDPIPGSPFFVTASPQDVFLPVCQMFGPGLTQCTAGERAAFIVEARDARGNRVHTGRAQFRLKAESAAAAESAQGLVVDRGDGSYEASYLLMKAGPYVLTVSTAGSSVTFEGVCVPGLAVVRKCFIAELPPARILAGTQASLLIDRRDVGENPVEVRQDLLAFTAQAAGPGVAHITTSDQNDGTCSVNFRAEAAGTYVLHLLGGPGKELLPGSPLKLHVHPNVPVADMLLVGVEGSSVSRALSSSDKDGLEVIEVVAGQPVTLSVTARDAYGNGTVWGRDDVGVTVVHLEEPCGEACGTDVQFTLDEVKGGRMAWTGTFTTARTLVLHVRFKDAVVPTWPRLLQVVAAPCDPDMCTVFAPEPAVPLWRETFQVRVQAKDVWENLLPQGGDSIDGFLEGPGGLSLRPTHVEDHGNGTYTIYCMVTVAGEWTLLVLVNNEGNHRYKLEVKYGPLKASHCELLVDRGKNDIVTEGHVSDIAVQPVDYVQANHEMTQADSVILTLRSPSGLPIFVPMTLDDGRFLGRACWVEVGAYTVLGFLNHEHVHYSPLTVHCISEVRLGDKDREQDVALKVNKAGRGAESGSDDEGFIPVQALEAAAEGDKIPTEPPPRRRPRRATAGNPRGARPKQPPKDIEKKTQETETEIIQYPSEESSYESADESPPEPEQPSSWGLPDFFGRHKMKPERKKKEKKHEYTEERTTTHETTEKLQPYKAADDLRAEARRKGRRDKDGDKRRASAGAPAPAKAKSPGADLAKCVLTGEGLRRCIAGQKALVVVQAKDQNGKTLSVGGDVFTAFVKTVTGQTVTADVSDEMNGKYNVTFTVETAGPLTVHVRLYGAERYQAGVCEPGPMDPSKCILDTSDLTNWRVGKKGRMGVERRDAFNNPITKRQGLVRISGAAAGAGKVDVTTQEKSNGCCDVLFNGTKAGQYRLRVFEANSQRELYGSPVLVTLRPGVPLARKCEVKVLTPSLAKTKPGVVAARVGLPVEICVRAFDMCGNATEWESEDFVALTARGPLNLAIAEAERTVPPHELIFSQTFTRSGGYTLQALYEEAPITAGDKVLILEPDTPDPTRCLVNTGGLPGGLLVVNEPKDLVVQGVDCYGNLCHAGGEKVGILLRSTGGKSDVKTQTFVDREDGTYVVPVEVDAAGIWSAEVVMNGLASGRQAVELQAVYGKIKSSDVVLKGGASETGEAMCMDQEPLYIQTVDFGKVGRRMLGNEALVARVWTPTGVAEAIDLTFAESAGRYHAKVRFGQAGPHTVAVLLDGLDVKGSPYSVEVAPSDLWLPACRLVGAGLSKAVAGEAAMFTLHGADRTGNALAKGGAHFSVRVLSEAPPAASQIRDNQDGTYNVIFLLTQAGPYKVVLTHNTDERVEFGACVPGPTSVQKSMLLGDNPRTWVAGQASAVRVRRCDEYENVVPFAEGLLPFGVRANGPGEVTAKAVEVGDGCLDLRCTAKVAGEYRVGVYGLDADGAAGAEMDESPLEVTVMAGPVDPAACVARFGAELSHVEATTMVVAGEYVDVVVEARDAFGNLTNWNDNLVFHVDAEGPQSVTLDKETSDPGASISYFAAGFTTAGSYLVKIVAGRANLPGWPRILQVIPGPVAPARCTIMSDKAGAAAGGPLADVQADRPVSIMLRTCDDFGNYRSDGGAKVECVLVSTRGSKTPAEIHDLEDGTYSIQFTIPMVGRWRMELRINGRPVGDVRGEHAGFEFSVSDGPVRPDGLMLLVDAGDAELPFPCGTGSRLITQVVDEERQLTGKEALSMRVTSPSGLSSMLTFTLAESKTYYAVQHHWSEVGEFVISATLDGVDVRHSPAAIQVTSQLLYLPTSAVDWPSAHAGGSSACVAGEPNRFVVQAHDRRGNRVEVGGERVVFEVVLEQRVVTPKTPLKDLGGGRYEGVVTLERVADVPYQIVLSKGDDPLEPTRQLAATCAPAETHFPHCVVEVEGARMVITAGQWGSFGILRRDRFRNPVLDTSTPAFQLRASGPAPLETELVDQAGGRCEARLRGTTTGVYKLMAAGCPDRGGVADGGGGGRPREIANGSLTVHVVPAHIAPARTLAWVFDVDADEWGPATEEELAMTVVMPVGAPVHIYFQARDAHGNVTEWGSQVLKVHATGPADCEFGETHPPEGADRADLRVMAGVLTRAGTYTLSAKVDGVAPAGWPRTLQAIPGGAHPANSLVKGPALTGAVCGAPAELMVVTMDSFNNPCSSGGDRVELVLVGPDNNPETVALETVDNENGTYSAAFDLSEPGTWGVRLTVNDVPGPDVGLAFISQPGAIQAGECMIQRDETNGPHAYQFRDDVFLVGTLDPARQFTGQELVLLQFKAPSASTTNTPMQFDDTTATWWAEVTYQERGPHKVAAFLNGAAVTDSPLTVKVRADDADDGNRRPGDPPEGAGEPEFSLGVMKSAVHDPKKKKKKHHQPPPSDLDGQSPDENAAYLQQLPPAESAGAVAGMDPAEAAELLERLDPAQVRDLMLAMMDRDPDIAAAMLANTATDRAAAQLRDILAAEAAKGAALMDALAEEDAAKAAAVGGELARSDPAACRAMLNNQSAAGARKMFDAASDGDLRAMLGCASQQAVAGVLDDALAGGGDPEEAAASMSRLAKAGRKSRDPEVSKKVARAFALSVDGQPVKSYKDVLELMPAEDSAALLTQLVLDKLQEVLRAMDETQAQDVLEALSAARDLGPLLWLPQCALAGDGLYACMAGEPAAFEIETFTNRGERIKQGGAVIDVVIACVGQDLVAAVDDLGDGRYRVSYEVRAAGTHNMVVSHEGILGPQELTYNLECQPTVVDLSRTLVDLSQLQHEWLAGDWVEAKVTRCDRFGNKVLNTESHEAPELPEIAAAGAGPGEMEVEVEELPDGTCAVCLMSKVAGTYKVEIWGALKAGYFAEGKRLLPGLPTTAEVYAGPTDAAGSMLTVARADPQLSTSDTAVVVAGDDLMMRVLSQDEFGNPTDFDRSARLSVALQEMESTRVPCVQVTATAMTFATRVDRAGMYRLHAAIDDEPLANAPKFLRVAPRQPDALASLVVQKPQGEVPCGKAVHVTVLATDSLGNACIGGGHAVTVQLEGPGRARAATSSVADNADGTYQVDFSLPEPGLWLATPIINKRAMDHERFQVTAVYGEVTPRELALLGGGRDETLLCGSSSELLIQANAFDGSARPMQGNELLAVTLVAPSKVRQSVPLSLQEGSLRYQCVIPFSEVGAHTVEVQLGGVDVPGSPYPVHVTPQQMFMPNCFVEGHGAGNITAGLEASFTLVARDRHGNNMLQGGAPLGIKTLDMDGRRHDSRSAVRDNGDGTYRVDFVCTKAGPYTVELAGQGAVGKFVRAGACLPGQTSPPHCRLDLRPLQTGEHRWIVGKPLAVQVRRFDMYNNLVVSPAEDKPPVRFNAEVTGPGQVATDLVEVGDGSFEVRLMGRTVGKYAVSVVCGVHEVLGSPFEVFLYPSRATAFTCRTSIIGVQQNAGSSGVLISRAGDPLTVDVEPLDQYGNATCWEDDQTVTVSVVEQQGPSMVPHLEIPLAYTKPQPGGLGVVDSFTGSIIKTGSFLVWLRLNNQVISGWPRILEISPGSIDPSKAEVSTNDKPAGQERRPKPEDALAQAQALALENEALRTMLASAGGTGPSRQ